MAPLEISRTPAFLVTDPEGNRARTQVEEFPFTIGRQAGNHLLLRDARASRQHARLTFDDGDYILEDLQSRHGVFVNGERILAKALQDGDRVEFGFGDSFSLVFERPGSRMVEIADQFGQTAISDKGNTTHGGLPRLRAVLEVARALQTSFSIDAILNAVLDAALAITHAERAFLLLKKNDQLEFRSARSRTGALPAEELKVPRSLILQALESRSQTLSMQFDPERGLPSSSAFALELKSVVCIPLVQIQISNDAAGRLTAGDTLGVLYLDSRIDARDLASGNQELLETLAIEASTVLENARLLEQDRKRQIVHEELALARSIQQSLLPGKLPETGWLRAAGHSMPSREVGGDYFDLFRLDADRWACVVADVAGKGVSAALGASLLQGAFLGIDANPESLRHTIERLDAFVKDRGQKHATVFCALIDRHGNLHYINAGHCAPLVVRRDGVVETLDATASAVGLLDSAFTIESGMLEPGDRIVVYTDGLTDAQDQDDAFFGARRLRDLLRAHAGASGEQLHHAILEGVEDFTGGREQADDLTLLVLEYFPDSPA